ncbi:MAG: sulfotransferase [Halioglobus sp.]|nr:sulfotransferase [Halioglobus sp.]
MNAKLQQIAEHHAAAQKALQAGQLRAAHQHCLAILRMDTSFADAWFLCGIIAAHNGQVAKAIEILEKSVELAPQNPEYRTELGKQRLVLEQPERALQEADRALALNPGALPVLNTLGTLFSHTGEHGKALRCFDKAEYILQKRPQQARGMPRAWQAAFYFNQAVSLQFAGRLDAAENAYEKAIQLQPQMFKAHSALSTLRRQTPENNHLERLNALRSEVADARDQLHLGHAIAKELEDLGQYREAFASLEWAKQAQAATAGYSVEAEARHFAAIMQRFNRESIRASRTGCDNPEPIFIVGMPRTGTTLVEQILSGHSQVFAAGELQNFPLQVRRATGAGHGELFDIESLGRSLDINLPALGAAYIDSTRPRTGHTPRFIDKLPLNFLLLGLIHMVLPNAKLVCLRRDPMDTCLSNFRQLFAIDFKPYHYNYNLLDCGRYFMLFDRLMQHWAEVMPGAVHEVSYEALVADPQQVTRELLHYCDLPWEEQCLDVHRRTASVATPSAVQVKQQIYRTSIGRWRQYGDAMQPLYELLRSAGYYQ